MSISSTTTTLVENSDTLHPTTWFNRTTKQLTDFHKLFDNLKQLMAFEEGQKPWIDHSTKVLSVDPGSYRFTRWLRGAFDTKFVQELCNEVLKTLTAAKDPLAKGKMGETLRKNEAWTVQKAFHIAQLLLFPPFKIDGTPGNTLEEGFANLMFTYKDKPNTHQSLNDLSRKWVPILLEACHEVLKDRNVIEQTQAKWNEMILNRMVPAAQLAASSSKPRLHERSPLSQSSSPKPPAPLPRHRFNLPIIKLKPTVQRAQPKPLPAARLAQPSSSNAVADETLRQLVAIPHKQTILNAPPNFLDTLKKKLTLDPNRLEVLNIVEKRRNMRIEEVNRASNGIFRNRMLQRAFRKFNGDQEDFVDDFVTTEENSNSIEPKKPAQVRPCVKHAAPDLTRSISDANFSLNKCKEEVMKRTTSELNLQNTVTKALATMFENALREDEKSESWTDDD